MRIGITQRVVYLDQIKERRDTLDQRWYEFSEQLGIELIPISNNLKDPTSYSESLELQGVIFSGGNNIGVYGEKLIDGKTILEDDVAYERDQTEVALLKWAISKKRPVVGVCRGLQLINAFFKGEQVPVEPARHVACEHPVRIINKSWEMIFGGIVSVNSYHNWGITTSTLSKDLVASALFEENEVEAFYHVKHPISGIMWHPERYSEFKEGDLKFFELIFNQNVDGWS